MTRLRVLLARLLGTLTGRRREDELREELETHLELLADEHRRRGLSDAQARLAARRELGGIAQTREAFRDTRVLPAIDALRQDLRFAWRALIRDRSTTLAAIALLTVGVSSAVVLVDALDRLLLRPPSHVDDPARVRRLYAGAPDELPYRLMDSYVTLERLAAGTREDIEAIAPYFHERIGSGHGRTATRFDAIAFGAAYFDVLGIRPHLGVLPSARRPVDESAVVISHAVWQERFGGAPDVIGRPLRLGRRTHTVVAVGPRGFAGVDDEVVDVWVPLEARITPKDWRTNADNTSLLALARLRPGADLARANAHASQVYQAVHRHRLENGRRPSYRIVLGDLPPAQAPRRTPKGIVLVAATGVGVLVLLMACGNVGNLLILSGLRRGAELSMKAALGATRWRLARELVLQALLLAMLAGAAALAVALTAGGLVRALFLPAIAGTAVGADARLVGVTIATCAGAAFILGLAPAISLTSARTLAPGRTLRRRESTVVLGGFVVLQVALSVPLVVGTLLFVASMRHATHLDLGVEPSRVLVVRTNLADDGRPDEQHAIHRRIQDRLRGTPGVAAVSLAQGAPLEGGYAIFFSVDDDPPRSGRVPFVNAVDPSFFEALGLRLVTGRIFSDVDNRPTAERVAVVNEAMAAVFWPGRPSLGRCLHVQGERDCTRVVGVVARLPFFASLTAANDGDFEPQVLLPLERFGALNPSRNVLVRTVGDPRAMLTTVQREAQDTGNDVPYVDVHPLDEVFDWELKPLRLGWSVFLALSSVALLIAVAGLVVVTAHGVTRRTREMGIRLVLGATRRDLVRLIARRTLIAMALGVATGSALAFLGVRLLQGVLFGVKPGDPRVLAAAAVAVFVAGSVAAYIPARRTGRIDPSAALRID
jgi:putative ABC transport system permease protein